MEKLSIAVHAGAQNRERPEINGAKEKQYRLVLAEAVDAGWEMLLQKAGAVAAVESAVRVLEDSPLFNAARGSVLNSQGRVECDAAIMRGDTLMAGAVAAVSNVRNPITLARIIMEKNLHLMICSTGAEAIAKQYGLELAENGYFITREQLTAWKQKHNYSGDGTENKNGAAPKHNSPDTLQNEKTSKGTVGAVAMDHTGTLAAATSTGGLWGKLPGRIGDSPVIGAGTYADNRTCAVSCTGDGEFIIRGVYAHELHCLIRYRNLSLKEACRELMERNSEIINAEMGLISIDAHGNIEMIRNTSLMFRASRSTGSDTSTYIWDD
ncbi:MAG: isoaspartyl peptidase/L-asparaginase family protein [Bacteroidota bacterium]